MKRLEIDDFVPESRSQIPRMGRCMAGLVWNTFYKY